MNQISSKPFAEVIESSLHGFVAQSWEWDSFPAFGSLVTIETEKRTLIGIVHQIQTGSMDPNRHPFPYKKTEAELRREQPQIFEFLRTTFSSLTIGYQEKAASFYMLPPEPVKIHAFVQTMSHTAAATFFANDAYLHLIFSLSNHLFNLDELLLAILKYQADLGLLTKVRMATFINQFSLLTGNDYRRLKLFLQRAEPIVGY